MLLRYSLPFRTQRIRAVLSLRFTPTPTRFLLIQLTAGLDQGRSPNVCTRAEVCRSQISDLIGETRSKSVSYRRISQPRS